MMQHSNSLRVALASSAQQGRSTTLGEAITGRAPSAGTAFAKIFAEATNNAPPAMGAATTNAATASTTNAAAKTGSDESNDYGAENFLQYVFARANDKATDAKDAAILRNDAGALVMLFAGYYPAGMSYQQMADRFLSETRPLY